jgi:hypothetical protein
MFQCAVYVAPRIAVLELPRNDHIERCAGNNTKLAQPGNRACQLPARDGEPHPALDDSWRFNLHDGADYVSQHAE